MPRRPTERQTFFYKKTGAFVRYATDHTTPIEAVVTSFRIDELSWLSYARRLRTKLNFDLLIQRDINEERAISDISEYIAPERERHGNDLVFLPPIIAAIVSTDESKELERAYPDQMFSEGEDEFGPTFVRQWGSLFQVVHYPQTDGYSLALNGEGLERPPVRIDANSVEIGITLTGEEDIGAKLVVIDGQHRLYALKWLKHNHPDRVRDLLIPVCIVYAPNSTRSVLDGDPDIPTVPEVLRELFVDVNSTAQQVSGHFVILLSDNTLGSMICRTMCDDILSSSSLGPTGLAQIEWNEKNDKQSKTIGRDFTLTSIGVIYDALAEVFKTRDGLSLLRYMLNLEEKDFEFGEDESGDPKPEPREFPWRDFSYQHKEDLRDLVRRHFSPALASLFFDTKAFAQVRQVFLETLESVIEKEIVERSSRSNAARVVRDHLLEFQPCEGSSANSLLDEFLSRFSEVARGRFPDIVRTNVFQKGMLHAWLEVIKCGRFTNAPIEDITAGFISLLDAALEADRQMFMNDTRHLYLQDSVYDGVRIKPTVECRKQILRLILGLLGNEAVCDNVVSVIGQAVDADKDALRDRLEELGIRQASYFIESLENERMKQFEKTFKANTILDATVREELVALLAAKEDAKRMKVRDKSVEIPVEFDERVKREIAQDFSTAQDQLETILGFSTVGESYSEDVEED